MKWNKSQTNDDKIYSWNLQSLFIVLEYIYLTWLEESLTHPPSADATMKHRKQIKLHIVIVE